MICSKRLTNVILSLFVCCLFPTLARAENCEIRVGVPGLIDNADPIKAINWWSKRFVTLQTETLVRFDTKGSLQPWLAKKWILSPDKLTLEIELRKGILFSDGSALTSADVVASLNRWSFDKASVDRGRMDDVKSISVKGPFSLQVHFKRPFLPFISYLATPRSGIAKLVKGKFVGTGPWRLAHSEASQTSFKVNDSYFQGRPKCGGLRLVKIPNAKLLEAIQNDEVDFAEYFLAGKSSLDKVSSGKNGVKLSVFEIPTYDVTNLFFTNGKKQSLSRQERKWIFDSVFQAPEMKYNSVTRLACSFIPAGLAVSGGSLCGKQTEKDAPPIKRSNPLEIYGPADERMELVNALAKRLRAKGMNVTTHSVGVKELYQKHGRGEIVAHMETLTMQIPDPFGVLSMYVSGASENFSGYSNKAFDEAIGKATSEFDPILRDRYYSDAIRILSADYMLVPLVNQSRYSIVSSKIEGFEMQSVGPFYSTYHQLSKREKASDGK